MTTTAEVPPAAKASRARSKALYPGEAELNAELRAIRAIGRAVSGLPPTVAMNALGRMMYSLQEAQRSASAQPESDCA